jgi:phospholipid/cholesterol/gamma-HCH transport system permease protein
LAKPALHTINSFLRETGEIGQFTGQFFRHLFYPPYELKEIIKQCYEIGYKSLPLVGITAFIMGLVFTLQSRPTLLEFGADAMIPQMVSRTIVREFGPVITGLICAGKIGSSIGAELGSMRVTEQIDAMDVSGTRPFKYLVFTRVVATTFMLPVLVILADTISMYGSLIALNLKTVESSDLFFGEVFKGLEYSDVFPSIIKTIFFGFAIGIIGCYKGYTSNKGTEGVGRAANSGVVISSLVIFIIDLITVQITDLFMLL